jgi:hypothetical protein
MRRPARTVRVRTKEELDAAFATADQIVVDGDDSLLSYAVSKASNDPENNQVSVDFEPGPRELPRTGKADVALRVRAVGGISSPLLPLVLAVAVAVLAILVGAYYYYSAAIHISPQGIKPPGPTTPPLVFAPTTPPPSDFWSNLPSLMWPLAAIVAIVALFLIARQAVSSGSNVTIIWKVTEKVTGRVVITKVRERATKSRVA